MTEEHWVIVATLTTTIVIGYFVWRVAVLWREIREDPTPSEISESSHEMARDTFVINAKLRQLKSRDDPLAELIDQFRNGKL